MTEPKLFGHPNPWGPPRDAASETAVRDSEVARIADQVRELEAALRRLEQRMDEHWHSPDADGPE